MIKYECESCGQLVVTEEALGQDVYEGDVRGRTFLWTSPSGQTITMMMEDQTNGRPDQFCYACLFANVRAILKERFPVPVHPSFDPMIPDPDIEVQRIYDQEAAGDYADPGDSGASEELSELYAQGKLHEPRSDFTSERPISICSCERRSSDGVIIWQNPSCPVHSPGGSPGPGGGQ